MEYKTNELEQKWAAYWQEQQTYRVENDLSKPKYYVLDMFPYPSGAGLHVGHPLGYIASDIFARYKRLKGFNVLHPMGYDSFGLPAEQYAIETGVHPAKSTQANLLKYRSQMDKLGFSFDWSREVATSDPGYYRWTQWIFQQLFQSWYNQETDRAEPIETLLQAFEANGNLSVKAVSDEDVPSFTAAEWNALSAEQQHAITLKYRLTYLSEESVNWCPGLGTVLSNDEVKDGFSERGGFPVVQKRMKQWMMRISAYSERLLQGLETIDWPEAMKETQRNWIGKSVGAEVTFALEGHADATIKVYTTRVDTIFGVTFMVLAPEHELVAQITTPEQQADIDAYIEKTNRRSERDRMADTKTVSGAFTGAYCLNPFNGERIPVWIADYVLAGYGTGAVMAVPSGDQRDWNFATHFQLPIIPILDSQQNIEQQADATKAGRYINSGLINGMEYKEATHTLIAWLEERKLGKAKTNYRQRDAIFSRQRYWGEPVPVFFKNDLPYLLDESELPLTLPEIDKYQPTEEGEPPLGRAKDWKHQSEYEYELSTMPGWAGSSWYWYRYMDPQNTNAFASSDAINYWRDVDLYLGGPEHGTGHLLYSRFWNKFLKDRGYVPEEEPFKKLINQGMIQGTLLHIYLVPFAKTKQGEPLALVWSSLPGEPVAYVHPEHGEGWLLPSEQAAKRLVPFGFSTEYTRENKIEYRLYEHVLNTDIRTSKAPEAAYLVSVLEMSRAYAWLQDENGKNYIDLSHEVGKMSKSKYNTVNPDDIVARYGADCFRMYEMFLGPIEQSKPWDTKGIDGVSKFLRKVWSLFYDDKGKLLLNDVEPTREELKVLHTLIKKVTEDIERFAFNTCVSAFMVAVNEWKRINCHKKAILRELAILLAPFAPYTAEELWAQCGEAPSVHQASFPICREELLVEDTVTYPVSINGKTRTTIDVPADMAKDAVEKLALEHESVQKWLEGQIIKKVIVVPGRMVNIVL